MLIKSELLRKISVAALSLLIAANGSAFCFGASAENQSDVKVDLSKMTCTVNGESGDIKVYSKKQYDSFAEDLKNGSLPEVYATQFLFDGVGMVKTPDLDDFVEAESNDTKVKTLDITAINVNTTGNIEFTGEITGGMIAVNTNDVKEDINLILNGVNLDTDSKKAPALYVYNKDINYTDCKVTVKTVKGTENYLEGGKFKKVSLVGSDELENYTNSYSGKTKTNYSAYTNYYGIYTSEQINNILFAKVQASNEDLSDGDPYYFYKGAGAVSSDIDLYFNGEGYLSVKSKNKEGIETKGNLTLTGGTGDYYIFSQDDCLNTTTSGGNEFGGGGFDKGGRMPSGADNVRNTMTINVNSLTAVVDPEGDEGDAIDSNGYLYVNGGTVVALAHPSSQDDGLDSGLGTYINGGTVAATGNMSDTISNESKQQFMKLNFAQKNTADSIVCVTDTKNNPVIAFKSDRAYSVLTLSTPDFKDGTYYVYKDGNIQGTNSYGLYTEITSYSDGTQQQWSGGGNNFGGGGRMFDDTDRPTPPEWNESDTDRPTPPDNNENNQNTTGTASVEFTLSSSSHVFNNVKDKEASTGDVTNKKIFGDVNNDGMIQSDDSLLVLRASVSLEQFDEVTTKLADADGDSILTSADALEILRVSVGYPSEYNVGKTYTE